jgi:hypothetical protein
MLEAKAAQTLSGLVNCLKMHVDIVTMMSSILIRCVPDFGRQHPKFQIILLHFLNLTGP